jgi:hypothetical protein
MRTANTACVIIPTKRSCYRSRFRYLDKHAPGWWLGYKSDETNTTNFLMELIDDLDIEEPAPLIEHLRFAKYQRSDRKIIDRLPIFVTREQGVLLVMFLNAAPYLEGL